MSSHTGGTSEHCNSSESGKTESHADGGPAAVSLEEVLLVKQVSIWGSDDLIGSVVSFVLLLVISVVPLVD